MRTSSTRLRMSAALAVTTLGLFSLGGSAFAGEGNGKGEDGRAATTSDTTEERGGSTSPSDDKAAQFDADQRTYDGQSSRHPSGNDRTVESGGSGTQGNSTSDPDGDLNGGEDKPGGPGGLSTEDQDGNNGCGNDQDFEDDNNGWCGRKPKKAASTPAAPVNEVEGRTTERCPKGGELAAGEKMPKGCDTDQEKECPKGHAVSGGPMTDGCDVTGGALAGAGATDVTTVARGAVLATQLQNATATDAVETRVLGVTIERGARPEAAPAGTETSVLGASFARGGALARTGFGLTVAGLVGLALVLVGVALQRAGRDEHGPVA